MADPDTPHVGFQLPTVGLDRDVWGNITNGNWTLADSAIQRLDDFNTNIYNTISSILDALRSVIEPVGSIRFWPEINPPAGWLALDGQAISRSAYPDLFALIGTWYGAGDGSTTFNLPNAQGTVLAHRGNWIQFGQSLGETTHVLTVNEMAVHQHGGTTDPDGAHAHTYIAARLAGAPNAAGGFTGSIQEFADLTSTAGTHQHNFATGPSGQSWGHNNVQPTLALMAIIKAVKVI